MAWDWDKLQQQKRSSGGGGGGAPPQMGEVFNKIGQGQTSTQRLPMWHIKHYVQF